MANALQFDAAFYERPLPKQNEYLFALAASQNEALRIMQEERNAGLVIITRLTSAVQNAQNALDQQKTISTNMGLKANADNQSNGERIRDLERKLEELGGDLNSVGQ
jgi:hypothetical protein